MSDENRRYISLIYYKTWGKVRDLYCCFPENNDILYMRLHDLLSFLTTFSDHIITRVPLYTEEIYNKWSQNEFLMINGIQFINIKKIKSIRKLIKNNSQQNFFCNRKLCESMLYKIIKNIIKLKNFFSKKKYDIFCEIKLINMKSDLFVF